MDFKNIIKGEKGIQNIRIIEPSKEIIKMAVEEILKSKIKELNIDNHYDEITDLKGNLAELLFSGQEISFKLIKI